VYTSRLVDVAHKLTHVILMTWFTINYYYPLNVLPDWPHVERRLSAGSWGCLGHWWGRYVLPPHPGVFLGFMHMDIYSFLVHMWELSVQVSSNVQTCGQEVMVITKGELL
jgi:hypothetical protein